MQLQRSFQRLRGIFRQKKATVTTANSSPEQKGVVADLLAKDFAKKSSDSLPLSKRSARRNPPSPALTASTASARNQASNPPVCQYPAHVLIADDNLLVRTSLANLMEQWGLTYSLAANGLAAWQHLQQSEFDLILIDLQMPGLDGHEVMARLSQTRNNANVQTPVIVLAGNEEVEVRKQIQQMGVSDFLGKPFEPQQLFKLLNKHLRLPATQQTKMYTDTIDQRALDQLYCGDYEHLNEMFQLFLRNTPSAIQAMEQAMRAKDWSTMEREIHKVKPTFAMVGLQKITQMAGSLEARVRQTRQLNGQLKQEFLQFKRVVTEAIKTVSAQKQSIRPHLK